MVDWLIEQLQQGGAIRTSSSLVEIFLALVRRVKDLLDQVRRQSDEIAHLKAHISYLANELYGRSSERNMGTEKPEPHNPSKKDAKDSDKSPPQDNAQPESNQGSNHANNGNGAEGKPRKPSIKKPSERYPHAEVRERIVDSINAPLCPCCNQPMQPTNMFEESERLRIEPRKPYIERVKRRKYVCPSRQEFVTTPLEPRIYPQSVFGDCFLKEVVLSKYAFLLPIHRFVEILSQQGFSGLPPQSLIGATHVAADFVTGSYLQIKKEAQASLLLHADETPHRMLENHGGKRWYLWNFSTPTASYFEVHNTRSGDICGDFLFKSSCQLFMSDRFSGYIKSIRQANIQRQLAGLPLIQHFWCNAHARRKFVDAQNNEPSRDDPDIQFFIDRYRIIYVLEREVQRTGDFGIRKRMVPHFEAMHSKCLSLQNAFSSKSMTGKAISYFLNTYERLVLFINYPEAPIDNNRAERELRRPVVGRKTWYGTHSLRGAQTAAIFFSIFNSCRLNGLSASEYWDALVAAKHAGRPVFSPFQYKQQLLQSAASSIA